MPAIILFGGVNVHDGVSAAARSEPIFDSLAEEERVHNAFTYPYDAAH
jgi:hypothetical protein